MKAMNRGQKNDTTVAIRLMPRALGPHADSNLIIGAARWMKR